jgi:hypothetical protein
MATVPALQHEAQVPVNFRDLFQSQVWYAGGDCGCKICRRSAERQRGFVLDLFQREAGFDAGDAGNL